MFWVTDNFLMHHSSKSDVPKRRVENPEPGRRRSFERARFRMQVTTRNPRASDESESEILLSGDDELIGVHELSGSVPA